MTQNSELCTNSSARERQNSIFERFLSGSPFASTSEQVMKRKGVEAKASNISRPLDAPEPKGVLSRSVSVCSAESLTSGQLIPCYNIEDYIAPVLDSSTEILNDPNTDFRDVVVIYCDCTDDETKCEDQVKRTRSRSFLCNKLMRALEENPSETSSGKDHTMSQVPEEGKTIKFYSFAETLERKDEADIFRARKMSEIIS